MTTLKKPDSIDLSAIEELRGDAAPLYKKYSDYQHEQDAFVEMDETALSQPRTTRRSATQCRWTYGNGARCGLGSRLI